MTTVMPQLEANVAWIGLHLLPVRGESIFNVLSRLAWCNRLNTAALLRLLFNRRHISRSGLNLYQWESKIRHSLADVVHWPRISLDEEVTSLLLGGTDFLLSDRLRFCPICLSEGFHTIWHQFSLLADCPRHGCEIRATCQSCGKATPKYAFNAELFRLPYGCSQCSHPLAGVQLSMAQLHEGCQSIQVPHPTFESLYEWVARDSPWLRNAGRVYGAKHRSAFPWTYAPKLKAPLQKIAVRDLPSDVDCVSLYGPAQTSLHWRAELPDKAFNVRPRMSGYKFDLPLAVYRATLRNLERWIFGGLHADAAAYNRHLSVRISSEPTDIAEYEPRLLALALMRIHLEHAYPTTNSREASFFVYPAASIEHVNGRTLRLSWRAYFLTLYATWVDGVRRAQHQRFVVLNSIRATDDSGLAFYSWRVENVVEGLAVFPEIPGLPLRPFRPDHHRLPSVPVLANE